MKLWKSVQEIFFIGLVYMQPSDSQAENIANCNNFATIRTTSIVKQQQREKLGRDFMREQMTNYRQIRRQHSRQLQQVICYQKYLVQSGLRGQEIDVVLSGLEMGQCLSELLILENSNCFLIDCKS